MSADPTAGLWAVNPLCLSQICTADGSMEIGNATVYHPAAVTVANARMMAASKSLLAALEEARTGLLWYRDRNPGQADGSDDEAMERIDDAIFKATGEQP